MGSTTLRTWPSVRTPAHFEWRVDDLSASFKSPLNNYRQDLARTGAAFAFTVGWPVLTDDERVAMEVFLQLMKKGGSRTQPPIYAYTKRGVLTGAPLINGGAQTGTSLVTDGWTAGVTKIVAAGDFLSLATGQLVRAMADANSDGSGNATITIEPALRASPADDSAIAISDPRAKFKLATTTESMPVTPGKFAALTLDFEQDIFA